MPEREQKPCNTGIAIISDYGSGLADIEHQIAESSNLIDLYYNFIYENEFDAVEISESIIQIENDKKGETGKSYIFDSHGLPSETFFNEIPQELHQGMTKAIDPFYDCDPMM